MRRDHRDQRGSYPALRQSVRHLLAEEALDLPRFEGIVSDDAQNLRGVGRCTIPRRVGPRATHPGTADGTDLIEQLVEDLHQIDILVVGQAAGR